MKSENFFKLIENHARYLKMRHEAKAVDRLNLTSELLDDISVQKSDLSKAIFTRCIFRDCFFQDCVFEVVEFKDCIFINTGFDWCEFDATDLCHSRLHDVTFENCTFIDSKVVVDSDEDDTESYGCKEIYMIEGHEVTLEVSDVCWLMECRDEAEEEFREQIYPLIEKEEIANERIDMEYADYLDSTF